MNTIKQIINSQSIWQTCVAVKEDGKILYYTLKEGESLLEADTPQWKSYAGGEGLIKAKWNGTAWVECATTAEITDWEAEHPAPIIDTTPSTEDVLTLAVLELSAKIEAMEGENHG